MNILPTDKKFSLVETLFAPRDEANGMSFAEELRAAVDRPADDPAPEAPETRDDGPREAPEADDRHEAAHDDDHRPAHDDGEAPRETASDDAAPADAPEEARTETETSGDGETAASTTETRTETTAPAEAGESGETQVAELTPDMDVNIIAAALTAVTADNPAARIAPVATAANAVTQAAVVADDVVAPTGPAVLGIGAAGGGSAQGGGDAQGTSQTQQQLNAAAQAAAARNPGQNKPGEGKPGEMRVEVVTRSEPVVSRPTATLTPNAAVAAEAAHNGNGQQAGAGNAQTQNGAAQMAQAQGGANQPGAQMDPAAASFTQALRQARADIDGGAQGAERGNATGGEARALAGASSTSATSSTQATARTAPAAPPRPAPPVPVTEQVAVRITNAANAGTERVQIQLRPEHLGRVEVKLDFNADGRVTATVTADRPETLAQLQRDASSLDRALQQAGLDTDSGGMNFNLRNGGQNSANAGNGNGNGNALPGDDAGEQPAELVQNGDEVALTGGDRGVDIRI